MTDNDILTRLEELEIKQAFCDDLVDTLNQTVARQQQEIQQMQLQLKQLLEQMLKTQENLKETPYSLFEELPPHY